MQRDNYQKPRVISIYDVGSYGHGDAVLAAGNAVLALLAALVTVVLAVVSVVEAASIAQAAVTVHLKVSFLSSDGSGGGQGGC